MRLHKMTIKRSNVYIPTTSDTIKAYLNHFRKKVTIKNENWQGEHVCSVHYFAKNSWKEPTSSKRLSIV